MINQKRQNTFKNVAQQRQNGVVLVLEDIHDPHNAAAILRTCDAFGIQTVYFIFEKEEPFDPLAIGKASSSSANKWLTFKTFTTSKACFSELQNDGFVLYATALDKEAQPLYDADFTESKIALLVGNEHAGLSTTALEMSDKKIYIPMKGFVQSLNVSVATALCIFQIISKRATSDFVLRDDAVEKQIAEWKLK